MSLSEAIALIISVSGLAGLVLTALRWRRDDTTAIVSQQSVIVHDMESLTGQLRQALADCEERAKRR